jgi:hypothetical protein
MSSRVSTISRSLIEILIVTKTRHLLEALQEFLYVAAIR